MAILPSSVYTVPVDHTFTGLSGTGTLDVITFTLFTKVIVNITTLAVRGVPTTADTEKVLGVGYFEMGFAAAAPWSANYFDPTSLWINDVHCWFDVPHYNWLGPGVWDKIRYFLYPGNVITLWLAH